MEAGAEGKAVSGQQLAGGREGWEGARLEHRAAGWGRRTWVVRRAAGWGGRTWVVRRAGGLGQQQRLEGEAGRAAGLEAALG